MPLLNQVFSFGLKAGTVVPLAIAKTTGNAMLNAIVKGSADRAAKGDYEYEIDEVALLDIDVNEPRLAGTAAIGGSIYGMLVVRFYQRIGMGERLALATELLKSISTSVDTIIQRNTKLGEAPSFGQSVILHDVNCRGTINYLNLSREVLQKNNMTNIDQTDKIVDTNEF